ncbi:hypothetical protein O1L60_25540 [Streptomyces diastatochromogenes]|nr:hypothetical protein [Streptomyces diastatochromogenes]
MRRKRPRRPPRPRRRPARPAPGAGTPTREGPHAPAPGTLRAGRRPLEIAAGLEAQGFTDRTAARFRHRDVFSLAEELYARVPRGQEKPAPDPEPEEPRAPWVLASLAPGGVAGLTGIGLVLGYGPARLAVGAAGRSPSAGPWSRRPPGPAARPDGEPSPPPGSGPCGSWRTRPAATDSWRRSSGVAPTGPGRSPRPLLALALAVAPAAWGAHLFARRARRRIADSRGLADFAAATRPLLLGTLTLQLLALAALLALTGFSPGALALGALLLLARLLTVHGFPETASAALAAASAGEALAPASVLAARLPLPGFDALATPVRALVEAWGPRAVPTLVCGAAALGLLAHATGALARASAHVTP